jgi:hypothetical protein
VNGNAIGHKKPQLNKTKQVEAELNSLQESEKQPVPEQTSLYSMFHHSQIREISFDL